MPDTHTNLEAHSETIGGYKLVTRIGGTGPEEVYRGEASEPRGRFVVVRLVRTGAAAWATLPEAMRTELEERLLREAATLTRLAHPNIVPVYEAGLDHGALYLAREYAPEGTLADALADLTGTEAPALPLAEVVSVVSQLAAALQAAHTHGVVHGTIAPAKVRLRSAPGVAAQARLADFGAAGMLTRETAGPWLPRTVAYLAPEQIEGETTAASDQYALAALGYQMLSGHLPFEGDIAGQTFGHLYVTAPPVRAHNPSIPFAVSAVIMRALAKRPEDRFPSASEFAWALRRAADEESAAAVPLPPWLTNPSIRVPDVPSAAPPTRPFIVTPHVAPLSQAPSARQHAHRSVPHATHPIPLLRSTGAVPAIPTTPGASAVPPPPPQAPPAPPASPTRPSPPSPPPHQPPSPSPR
ncbi:MAG: serine/threonine-protein kinase, partial [Ktedonobacterales bacterium]